MKDAITKIKEINAVIKDLDPAIKEQARDVLFAIAFENAEYPSETKAPAKNKAHEEKQTKQPTKGKSSDKGGFFSSFDHSAPKDNVNLIAAWLYSQHGVYPISAKEMKDVASSVGLVIPTRSDNTMRQAKKNGKALYRQNGKGWEPTVTGELFFKESYSVTKGSQPRE